MNWTQYIDGCGSDKTLLTQAIAYATAALQKIKAQEKAEEMRQEALKMTFVKRNLFEAALAPLKEQLDREIKEMIIEGTDEGCDPFTVKEALEQVLFGKEEIIKKALYQEYCALSEEQKWTQCTEHLEGEELLEWECTADECWYADNRDRMSTEIPVYKSRWTPKVTLCDVCFDNMTDREREKIVFRGIRDKLTGEFERFISVSMENKPNPLLG